MLSDGQHKPGSVKMGYYALKFLFTQIYHKEWAAEYLPTPKTAKTLPLVLPSDEVHDVLSKRLEGLIVWCCSDTICIIERC
jgi:integrase/recombinase XerD